MTIEKCRYTNGKRHYLLRREPFRDMLRSVTLRRPCRVMVVLCICISAVLAAGCGGAVDGPALGKSCDPTGRIRPEGTPDGDYRHYIFHAGRLYASDFEQPRQMPPFERRLGQVTCRVSQSTTPVDYSASREGEASFLDVGTPYFAVQGQPEQQVIGAEYVGKPRLFKVVPEKG